VIHPPEIASLTDFTNNATEAIERLKETGQPQVLTVDGRAEAVVLDVASYERLLELADRTEAIEGIRRGLESMARGRGRPVDEVFAELRARHGLPPS
jgi:prevent-host-death family protein